MERNFTLNFPAARLPYRSLSLIFFFALCPEVSCARAASLQRDGGREITFRDSPLLSRYNVQSSRLLSSYGRTSLRLRYDHRRRKSRYIYYLTSISSVYDMQPPPRISAHQSIKPSRILPRIVAFTLSIPCGFTVSVTIGKLVGRFKATHALFVKSELASS